MSRVETIREEFRGLLLDKVRGVLEHAKLNKWSAPKINDHITKATFESLETLYDKYEVLKDEEALKIISTAAELLSVGDSRDWVQMYKNKIRGNA